MKSPAIWAKPSLTATEAANEMMKNNIGVLPVLKNDKLIGIISRTDLLNTITL
jgi:CBS domain-containing protein